MGRKKPGPPQGDTASLKFQKSLMVSAPDGNRTSTIVVWGECMNNYSNKIKKKIMFHLINCWLFSLFFIRSWERGNAFTRINGKILWQHSSWKQKAKAE